MEKKQIEWKKDTLNNTLEGYIDGVMYFDIEFKTVGVVLYQMKKPLGNFIEFETLETAKEYCAKIAKID